MLCRTAPCAKQASLARLSVCLCFLGLFTILSVSAQSPKNATSTDNKAEPAEDAESFLPEATLLRSAPLTVGAVTFSPDGKRLAMGTGWDKSRGEVRLWDVHKRKMIAVLPTVRHVRAIAFSPDGKH